MDDNKYLKEYIENSELRVFNNYVKIRLSRDLAINYDNGEYDFSLNNIKECFDMILSLGIKFPNNTNPVLYIYIVPDNNYSKLLDIPLKYDNGNGGGKPVKCYDADGFNCAFASSQNLLQKKNYTDDIEHKENMVHELAHIVQNEFFISDQTISEGFAEALSLYTLDLECIYDEYKDALLNLGDNQIYNVHDLLESEANGTFGTESLNPDKSCSFRLSYISSYLFIRSCLELISNKFNLSKADAAQYFLDLVRKSNLGNEWLVEYIAKSIDIDPEILLYDTKYQWDIIEKISNCKNNIN